MSVPTASRGPNYVISGQTMTTSAPGSVEALIIKPDRENSTKINQMLGDNENMAFRDAFRDSLRVNRDDSKRKLIHGDDTQVKKVWNEFAV